MARMPFFAVTLALMALIGVRLASISHRTQMVGFTLISAACALIFAAFLFTYVA